MTVRTMSHDEILASVCAARDEIEQEAFRLRRQADSPAERSRAITWELLGRELDEAVMNLRMSRPTEAAS